MGIARKMIRNQLCKKMGNKEMGVYWQECADRAKAENIKRERMKKEKIKQSKSV